MTAPTSTAPGEVHRDGLDYFTHQIDGTRFGGWYRPLCEGTIEVLAVGLIRTLELQGRSPQAVACQALEEFVRLRQTLGLPLPQFHELENVTPTILAGQLDRNPAGSG